MPDKFLNIAKWLVFVSIMFGVIVIGQSPAVAVSAFFLTNTILGIGFFRLGQLAHSTFLQITSALLVIAMALIFIWSFFGFGVLHQITSTTLARAFGVLGLSASFLLFIPFGISQLRLKKQFGGIATAAGILNIISGSLMAIVIILATVALGPTSTTFPLAAPAILALITAIILEYLIILKAAKY